jgi:hypothetical protein
MLGCHCIFEDWDSKRLRNVQNTAYVHKRDDPKNASTLKENFVKYETAICSLHMCASQSGKMAVNSHQRQKQITRLCATAI